MNYFYLIFATNANARSRTEAVAQSLECNGTTTAWFDTIEHPSQRPQSALVIPEDQLHLLTNQERNGLKDFDFMDKNGWFPKNPDMEVNQ
jgi:hypothetical protein